MDHKTIADFEKNGELDIEAIIKNYNSYIYTILKNSITNQEDMEEILSDVFMVLWRNYERLDQTIKVKPYLVGITKNLVRKKYRKLKIQFALQENIEDYENQMDSDIDVPFLAEENEKSKIVASALEDMKKEEQRIFVMFYYKSKKIKEISRELYISEAKVKITLYRLRKSIRKKLKERGYDYGK